MNKNTNSKKKPNTPLALVTCEDAVAPVAGVATPKLSKAETITALVARALARNQEEREQAQAAHRECLRQIEELALAKLSKLDVANIPHEEVDFRHGYGGDDVVGVLVTIPHCPKMRALYKKLDEMVVPARLSADIVRREVKAKLDGHSPESPRIKAVLADDHACSALDAALDAIM